MNHTWRGGEVNDLLGKYKDGELTLDELAQQFRTHRWPRKEPPKRLTYLERAALELEDPYEPSVPDSFDDVDAAYFRHDLSDEEYEVLAAAKDDARRAEDRGEF